ncbi:MAG TPA: hypothetical protein PKD41_10465 [Solidesulfovibrio sp.]|nr:hypothetical protein [Desulfovibrio sp.]HML61309.1 hypothetical protein [Solidesulfovibrio sp.]
MKTEEMDRVLLVIQGLTVNGKESVTSALLYEAMGLTAEPDKARLRSRVNALVKRGELKRIADGKYSYHPKARVRSGEYYQRVWRAIRSAKPGFSWDDLAEVSRVSYTHIRKYGKWLLEEGYLERYGCKGTTHLFRATALARDTVETPYPPLDIVDPYETERNAACRLIRALMERDPGRTAVKEKIVENCRAILARFEKEDQDATA